MRILEEFTYFLFLIFSNDKLSMRDKGRRGWFVASLRRFASFIWTRNTKSLTKLRLTLKKGRKWRNRWKRNFKKTILFFFQEIVFMSFIQF